MKTLLIDNYDSYTFNLYQLIASVNGEAPTVITNDDPDGLAAALPTADNIVLSPGPGHPGRPRDFGLCDRVLRQCHCPVLGVCLGHQGLGQVFGAQVIHAPEVRHGRISSIHHHGHGLFAGIPRPFAAVRYHSLMVDRATLPDCLEVTAWTDDGLIMGLRHRQRPLFGVQFHPESICTEYGDRLLTNFNRLTQATQIPSPPLEPTAQGSGPVAISPQQPSNPAAPSPAQSSPSTLLSTSPSTPFKVFVRSLPTAPDPEQVFVHLYGDRPYAFWLDSSQVEPGLSRFSFMGDSQGPHGMRVSYDVQSQHITVCANADRPANCGPSQHIATHYSSIFDYLQRELEAHACDTQAIPFDFNGGFVGYLGYELKLDCGAAFTHPTALPDAAFFLVTQFLAFDHQENRLYLVYVGPANDDGDNPNASPSASQWFDAIATQLDHLPALPSLRPSLASSQTPGSSPSTAQGRPLSVAQPDPIRFHLHRSRSTYLADIDQCLREIHDGESYEVCLTNHISTATTPDPLTFYRHLRHQNPAPYAGFLRFGDVTIVSSSPERFLQVDRDRWVETKPIKGTVPRGKTQQDDAISRDGLQHSEKDRAENLMVLDLLRNDLGRVCEVGSIHVPTLMQVETYATVHQLVSTVRGQLRPDQTALDCVRAAFPGGSMTGAPKLRTMEIIDRLEGESRGIYSGAMGWLGFNGTADLNIVIRTAILTPTQTSIGVGGSIVALSDPAAEFDEMLLKAQALIHALVQTVHGTVTPACYEIDGIDSDTPEDRPQFGPNLVRV